MRIRAALAYLLLTSIACYEKSESFVNPVGGLTVPRQGQAPRGRLLHGSADCADRREDRAADRGVTFTTNVGTFLARPLRDDSHDDRDSSGVAIADLRSSANVETATVHGQGGDHDAANSTDHHRVHAGHSRRCDQASTSATVAPADGVTLTQLFADVSPSLTQRNVTFRTTNGKFSNDTREITVVAPSSNRAVVDLRSETSSGRRGSPRRRGVSPSRLHSCSSRPFPI